MFHNLRLPWDSPEKWDDKVLANAVREWANKFSRGKQFNLYNDLARLVSRGTISGTLENLQMLATRSYDVAGFGAVKYEALDLFLDQYTQRAPVTYLSE